jgi:hypothetical protein
MGNKKKRVRANAKREIHYRIKGGQDDRRRST